MNVTSGFSDDTIKVEIKEEMIDLNEVMQYSCEESIVWETNKEDFMNNRTVFDKTRTGKWGIEDACSVKLETDSDTAQLNLGPAFAHVSPCTMSTTSKRLRLGSSSKSTHESEITLVPSPYQLRRLWDFDNSCAHKYMGVPLRQCASTEPPDQPGASCLSEEMMSFLQNQIDDMWRKQQNILEVFHEESAQHLGYRLRVKEGLPIKVTMRSDDQTTIGWKAAFSESCTSSHLYLRSDLKGNQYLGGPLSYSNWAAPKDANLIARQVTHGSRKYLVRGECKVVAAGCELLWDYGKKFIPQFSNHDWFKEECCFIVKTIPKDIKSKESLEICRELCVLCGKPYKCNRRDWTTRKPQKKVHFINSHINFLGTDWDGCGDFDPSMYEVDYDRALIEAERLNRFLQRLHSDSWKAVPACAVMKKQELDTLSSDKAMKIFRKRCEMLNKLGSIVVRGRTVPSLVEHLHPIIPSSWHEVFPNKKERPKNRKYALSQARMTAMDSDFNECALQDIFVAIPRLEDSDSSSESDSLE